jgi:hypothetical protein
MLDASTHGQVRAAASQFAKANQGNIAVIFAIANLDFNTSSARHRTSPRCSPPNNGALARYH